MFVHRLKNRQYAGCDRQCVSHAGRAGATRFKRRLARDYRVTVVYISISPPLVFESKMDRPWSYTVTRPLDRDGCSQAHRLLQLASPCFFSHCSSGLRSSPRFAGPASRVVGPFARTACRASFSWFSGSGCSVAAAQVRRRRLSDDVPVLAGRLMVALAHGRRESARCDLGRWAIPSCRFAAGSARGSDSAGGNHQRPPPDCGGVTDCDRGAGSLGPSRRT